MTTPSEPPPSPPGATARGIALAGGVLIALFLTILSSSLFPIRLLDPAWQLQVGGALINASPFSLIGLVLLQLAARLDPWDPLLENRRRLGARLAAAAALGYLLLMPLLATASLRHHHNQVLESTGRLRRASSQLEQLRQVLSETNSVPELEQRMAALEGPRLDAADRSLPLPVLRSRVQALLDQASAQLERARAAAPPASPWTQLGDITRTTLASLALAGGFAGLAEGRTANISLLEALQAAWFRLRPRPPHRLGRSDRFREHQDYVQLMHQADEDEPPSGRGR